MWTFLYRTMSKLNVIDQSFSIRLFTDEELRQLNIVEPPLMKINRLKSMSLPSATASPRRKLPAYIPPSEDKFLMLDYFMSQSVNITKPEYPVYGTNTQLCNYVHRNYIYQQYVRLQLRRQKLYHPGYQNTLVRANLKHHYDAGLSRALSVRR